MEQRTPCLWVSYKAMASNGMVLSSNGFFSGQVPVTPSMLKALEAEIKNFAQDSFNKVKPVDQKGKIVIGAPTLLVQAIEITAIVAAEQIEHVAVN